MMRILAVPAPQQTSETKEKRTKKFQTQVFILRRPWSKNIVRKRNEAKKLKRNEAKKLVLCFRLSMRKQSEMGPVSLHFASRRKHFLCETGAPYFTPIENNTPPPSKGRLHNWSGLQESTSFQKPGYSVVIGGCFPQATILRVSERERDQLSAKGMYECHHRDKYL
jgi:hypothetical protein